MLAKRKAARQHAIAAAASSERKRELEKLKRRREALSEEAEQGGDRGARRQHVTDRDLSADQRLLSPEDPTSVLRAIGDHVNTRLQELEFDDDIDADLFDEKQRQLREEAELAAGTKIRQLASRVADFLRKQLKEGPSTSTRAGVSPTMDVSAVFVGHNSNAVTAVCSLGAETVVFGDKTGCVYLVDLKNENSANAKQLLSPRLQAAVMSIAVSDTRGLRPSQRTLFERSTVDTSVTSYLAVGAADGTIGIWVTATRLHLGNLTMHHSAVTGLAFRNDTLYSGGYDESLRVWALPQMSCEDRLFGHTGHVLGLHCLRRERCATVGDDGTMRFWKVDAATQQEFTASAHFGVKVTLECVVMMTDFVVFCGAANGALLVFDVGKRKPVAVREAAHGYGFVGDGTGLESEAIAMREQPEGNVSTPRIANPITAVAAIPYSDTAASASYDSVVRLWRVGAVHGGNSKSAAETDSFSSTAVQPSSLDCLASIPVNALVTSLYFPPTSDVLLIACSKEPRLGRWVVQRSALNSVYVVPLNQEVCRSFSSRTRVEHLPVLLYGINNGDTGTREAEEQGEVAEHFSASDGSEGAYGPGGEGSDGESKGDSSTDGGTGMFTIGDEGQMKFSVPLKNSGKHVGRTKESKKASGRVQKCAASRVSSVNSNSDAKGNNKLSKRTKKNKKKGEGKKGSSKGEE